jgi:hypothetical protein
MYLAMFNSNSQSFKPKNHDEIAPRNMNNQIMQNRATLALGWRTLAFPILIMTVVVMMGFPSQSAHAQQPVTQPTTGALSSELINPLSEDPLPDKSDTVTETSITETGNTKSYIKFELHQQAKRAFAGRLDVEGTDFQDSIALSISEGEHFDPYFVFTEQAGPYKLNLYSLDNDLPILWVEGHVERLDTGEYLHQLIGGDADPDYLKLTPEDSAVVIALGSVDATVAGCVSLFQPLDGRFELGVDINRNGEIDSNESTTHLFTAQSEICLDTPEATIPLTSFYRALVTDSSGNVVAKNEGIYDFLNKTSVSSNKESDSEIVQEFRIDWILTPAVVRANILNASLRSPAQYFNPMPKEKGKTADIIQNGEAGNSESPAPKSADTSSNENPFSVFIDYWIYIAIGAGLAIALIFTLKGLVNTPPISRSKK